MKLNKLDEVFSLYIRQRDSVNGAGWCISCGCQVNVKEADNGHYIDRKHMATRFNENNCNIQCKSCNQFKKGNIEQYRKRLIRKIGEEAVVELEALRNTMVKYSQTEINELIIVYKQKIKDLNK